MSVDVKICGLRDERGVEAALRAGARYIGFVFHPLSRRFIMPEFAYPLASSAPGTVGRVGLFVDPSDSDLRATLSAVPLDLIQLHGEETPARVQQIKGLTGLPVMKAIRVGSLADLTAVASFERVADRLLFDARVGHAHGGTGVSFDWTLLAGKSFTIPWMLAGGLNAGNVAEAVRITGATCVDVSSSVEDRSGQKDPMLIARFIQAAGDLPQSKVSGA